MTTLHLARHGETIWHAENRYAGSTDVPLTDRGRAQAAVLADWALAVGISAVATSDLSRAVETGRAVSLIAGAPLVVDARLREVDFGEGEGRTRAEMAELFPEVLAAFIAAPATSPLPGAESGVAAAERGLAALADLVSGRDDDAQLVVVAHSTLIRLVLCRLLGLPLDDYRRRFPKLANTAVTTIEVAAEASVAELERGAQLLRFNAELRA